MQEAPENITQAFLLACVFRRLGVDNPTTTEINHGRTVLNLIIAEKDPEGLHLWAISQTPKILTLTAGESLYTVGVGAGQIPGDIVGIEKAYLLKGASRIPLDVLAASDAIDSSSRGKTGEPREVHLEKGKDLNDSKFWVYPAPAAPYQIELFTRRALWGFSEPNDNPDFPGGWGLRLMKFLEKELAPEYDTDLNRRVLLNTEADAADLKGKAAETEKVQPRPPKTKFY